MLRSDQQLGELAIRGSWVLVLTGFLFVASCSLPSLSVAGEAEREAKKYWEQWLTKCGESYVVAYGRFGKPYRNILEWKSAKIEVDREQLTEADKLNNIEWKGTIRVTGNAFRSYDGMKNKWDAWMPIGPTYGIASIHHGHLISTLRKENGKWTAPVLQWSYFDELKKIDCADVPQ